MTGTLFLFEEIRPARIEHCRNARSRSESKKKRNARKNGILEEYFETIFIGTQQRRKDETQHCCICGELSVSEGKPTGHSLAHHNFSTII